MNEPLVLRMAVGQHNHVRPLRDGSVTSHRVRLEFVDFDPLPKAFRQMIRGADLDVSEMALTTQILAHHFGKPITALPIPLWRRLHHDNLVCAVASPLAGPRDLEGQKVGVRAYSQTTGVWIRGILQSEYGVDLDRITWITTEGAHVAEFQDPANVLRSAGTGLRELMARGEIVALMGERVVDPAGVRPVIPHATEAAIAWQHKTGILPVNHILAVRTALLAEHAWLADELMSLFERARVESIRRTGTPWPAYGLEENRAAMQMLLDFSVQQKLVPRPYDLEDLFFKADQYTF